MHIETLLSLLSCVSLVAAHARIRYPRPLAAPVESPAGNYYNGPLRADGSDFPCKGLHKRPDVDKSPVVTWQPGQETYFEILGHGPGGGEGNLAAHSGGSCQASISFDNGETWKVLHSFVGGCPRNVRLGSNMAGTDQVFKFKIPDETRAGNALFSWSWVAVTGNRNEYFQNCASIKIGGSGTSTLDDYPDMFVGDMTLTGRIGPGQCRSFGRFALEYPNPGAAVTKTAVNAITFKKPTDGNCNAKGSRQSFTSTAPSMLSTIIQTEANDVTATKVVSEIIPEVTPMIESTASISSNSNAPQCSSYTLITDKTRHSSYTHNTGCDKSVFKAQPTWVRFSGAAGTRLAPGPIEGFHCGTQGAGWYKGVYPTAVGATTTGTVCYSWPRNTCQWSNKISVTNCGGYYVFALIAPPACYLRYCTA